MEDTVDKEARIYVAGHRGLVGSAIVRRLQAEGHDDLLLRSRAEVDLTRQADVEGLFAKERPEYVFLAAARVGGILDNDSHAADIIRENLQIQTNVIEASYRNGVRKLLFLGSSCIYPRLASQPIAEEALLTGPLEPTNEAYAVATIAGIKMVQSYRKQYGFSGICAQPTNLFGPNDNFDLASSHVLPALLRKLHEAKVGGAPAVTIWGSGTPRRELLHADDCADACVHLMKTYDGAEIVNVGTGEDISILELAQRIRDVVGFTGELLFDKSKPDGTPRKVLDVSRLHALGWRGKISFAEGLRSTYAWFLTNGA
jgi:GDP-L-fucose synthase